MEWLIILSFFLSTLNFYFLFKKLSQKPFQQELEEFRSYSERIIVEFNRITTRNIELLDSRIAELDHKIRLSQKIDQSLKDRFEEANKIEFLHSILQTDNQKNQTIDKQVEEITPIPPIEDPDTPINTEIHLVINDIDDETPPKKKQPQQEETPLEDRLFNDIPVKKTKKPSPAKRQDLLKKHIDQFKTKEELLELGFNNNEINLAMLCHQNNLK